MYMLLVIEPPADLEPFQAHGLLDRFMGTGPATKAREGHLAGAQALNPFTFHLPGGYGRALLDLQRAADESGVITRLMIFTDAPTVSATEPLRRFTG